MHTTATSDNFEIPIEVIRTPRTVWACVPWVEYWPDTWAPTHFRTSRPTVAGRGREGGIGVRNFRARL